MLLHYESNGANMKNSVHYEYMTSAPNFEKIIPMSLEQYLSPQSNGTKPGMDIIEYLPRVCINGNFPGMDINDSFPAQYFNGNFVGVAVD